jgi:hypothetical protein
MSDATNTVCPVCGDRVDPATPPIDSVCNLRIGVCSASCAQSVKRNPQKFAKAASADTVA